MRFSFGKHKKNTIARLQESSEEPFRMLIQRSPEGIFLLDEEGSILEANHAMSRLYRTDVKAYLGKSVWLFDQEFIPRERRNKKEIKNLQKFIRSYLQRKGKNTFNETIEQEIAGATRFIQLMVFPIHTNRGLFYLRINSDVSESKATENELTRYKNHLEEVIQQRTQELERSNASLHLVLQSVPVVFYSYESDTRNNLWYSEQVESFSGFKAEKLIDDPEFWQSRVHPDDQKRIGESYRNIAINDRVAHEYRWFDAYGKEIWLYDQAVKIPATKSAPEQIVGCFIDITERKEAEISLRESEWNYREIFNSSSDAIFIHNFETGAIEDVNDTALTMFIASYDQLLEGGIEAISSGEPGYDKKTAIQQFEITQKQAFNKFEWRCKRGDGGVFWVDVILKKVILKGAPKMLAVVRDIHQKKITDEHLVYQTTFEKLILDISSRFINVGYQDIDNHIEKAIQDICQFSKTSLGYLFQHNTELDTIALTRLWHDEKILLEDESLGVLSVDISRWHLNLLHTQKVLRISTPEELPAEAQKLRGLMYNAQLGSMLEVPLFYQNTFIGFIGLGDTKTDRKWLDDEVSLLKLVGQVFINALKRKESFDSIQDNEQSYREIYNATAEAIIIMDQQTGRFLDVNNAMLKMFDLDYEQALQASFDTIRSGEDVMTRKQLDTLIALLPTQGSHEATWQGKRKNGELFWVEMTLKLAEIQGGERVLITLRDITERIEAARSLQENEEKYRMLVENQTDLIIKTNPEGELTYVSQSYCDLFGKPEAELLKTSFIAPVHKDDKEHTRESMKQLMKAPHTGTIEHRAFSLNGWRWHAWNNKAILDANNTINEILCVGRDITYQKGVEEALRRSEDRFRSIVQQLSDVVLICDRETNIIYDTPSILALFGYKEGYLIGQSLMNQVYSEDQKLLQNTINNLLQDKSNIASTEFRVINKQSRIIPVEGVVIDLLKHPSIHGLVITLRDISERKMVDKKILDAVLKTEEQERERFAKNLHDDVGPLLSSIKMYMGTLNSDNPKEKQDFIISQLQEIVKEAITTTKEVSNDLSPHILMNYGLISAIENFCKKVPADIKVNLNTTQIAQRYSNAVENSFYRITKELINNTLKHAGAHEITISLEETGQDLILQYADDGKGVDIQQIIKDDNPGMGISNIISRAKSLNGQYAFDSNSFGGFSFKMVIPLHQALA